MGSWGITERESDYGLDLLGTIVATQLKAVDFATFNVADTLTISRLAAKLLPLPGVPRKSPLGFFRRLRSAIMTLLERAFMP